ncbi:MAG: phage tail tape measure protein [Pseudomonadota bacterium]
MSDLYVSLIVALKDLVTGAPADKLKATFGGLGASAKEAGKDFTSAIKRGFSADNIDLALAQNERKLQEAKGRLQGALAMAAGLVIPVKLAADFEEQFIDFANVAEIPLDQQAAIEARLVKAAKTANKSKAEMLTTLSAYVGKGMDLDEALAAITATGRTATATKSEIEDMANSGFAVMDNLKVAAKDLGLAFDVMALSGKEGSFELKAMARKFPEITAGAKALKMEGLPAVASLTSALQLAMKSAGSEDQAATNFTNFLGKITSRDTVRNFKKLGVNLEKEMKDAQARGVDVLDHMLTLIKEKTGGDAFKMSQLFADKQVLDFLRAVIPNLEEYRRQRDKVAAADGSTIAQDYERVTSGLNSMTAELRNSVGMLLGSTGTLMPVIKSIVSDTTALVRSLSDWAAANPELTSTLVKAAAGLMAFSVASRVASFALYGIRGPLIKTASLFLKFSKQGQNISAVANGMRGLKAAAGFGFGGIVTAAKVALGLFAGLAGAVTLPIAGVVAALIGAGVLINRYWEPISNFASGFASAIGAELGAAAAALGQFVADVGGYVGTKLIDFGEWLGFSREDIERYAANALGGLQNMGSAIVSFFTELPAQIGDWLGNLFTVKDYSAQAEADFQSMGASVAEAMIRGIKRALYIPITLVRGVGREMIAGIQTGLEGGLKGVLDWFASLPSKILSAIGNIDIGSLISWPSPPRWLSRLLGSGSEEISSGDGAGTVNGGSGNETSSAPPQPIDNALALNKYSAQAEIEFKSFGTDLGGALMAGVQGSLSVPITLVRGIGREIIAGIEAGLEDGLKGVLDWFASLPSKILAAIGNIDISSLIRWPKPPGWLSRFMGGSEDDAISGSDGAGPVKGGSGNDILGVPPPLPSKAPPSTVNHVTENKPAISVTPKVHVTKGADAAEIARQVGAKTAQATRLALSDAGVN